MGTCTSRGGDRGEIPEDTMVLLNITSPVCQSFGVLHY